MASSQMNIRMDAELKEAGDAALARAGATPTEAVRLLWGYAKAHRAEPDQVARILQTLHGDDEDAPTGRDTLDKLQALRVQREACIAKMGGKAPKPYKLSSGQSLEDALAEQLAADRELRAQMADDVLGGEGRL